MIQYMTDLSAAQARAVMEYENAVRAEELARIEANSAANKVASKRSAMIKALCNDYIVGGKE